MRKPEQVSSDIKLITDALSRLTPPIVAMLHRIDRYGPDDASSGSAGIRGKNSISDPTGSKVARNGTTPDPTGDAIKFIDRRLFEMTVEVMTLLNKLNFVLDPQRGGRIPPPPTCLACLKEVAGTPNDRLRSGYCFSCYRRWLAEGKPIRSLFERQIQVVANEPDEPVK